jgi:hypothetical protein
MMHHLVHHHRPDAFEKHVNVCTPDNPGGPLGMPKSAAAKIGGATTSTPFNKVGGVTSTAGGRPTSSRPLSSSGGGAMRPGGGGNKGSSYGGGGPNLNSKPRAFTCYLCGTQHFSQRCVLNCSIHLTVILSQKLHALLLLP